MYQVNHEKYNSSLVQFSIFVSYICPLCVEHHESMIHCSLRVSCIFCLQEITTHVEIFIVLLMTCFRPVFDLQLEALLASVPRDTVYFQDSNFTGNLYYFDIADMYVSFVLKLLKCSASQEVIFHCCATSFNLLHNCHTIFRVGLPRIPHIRIPHITTSTWFPYKD